MATNKNQGTTGTPNTGRNEDRNPTNKGGMGSQQKQPLPGTEQKDKKPGATGAYRDEQQDKTPLGQKHTPAYSTGNTQRNTPDLDSTRKPGQPGGSTASKRPDHGTLEEENTDLDRTNAAGDEGPTDDEGGLSPNRGPQRNR